MYLRSRDDLPPSPLTLRSPLDDTRQIQNLDLGAPILQHTRDSRQRGERVGCGFGLGPRDLAQEGGLSDGGKPNQGHSRVAALANIESGATAA